MDNTLSRRASRKIVMTVAIVAMFVLTGCQLTRCGPSELPDDGPPIATSQEAARQFMERITDAGLNGSKTGQFTLTVTQEEVTSFLEIGSKLADQLQSVKNLENLEDLADLTDLEGIEGIEGLDKWQQILRRRKGLPKIRLPSLNLRLSIEEPEVRFQANGHIIVRGYGRLLMLRLPLRVVLAPRADDGELVFDFVEGNLGRFKLPEGILDLIGKGLAQAILLGQDYGRISQIDVRDGVLTLSGSYDKEKLGG
jgi:hypothetical protein